MRTVASLWKRLSAKETVSFKVAVCLPICFLVAFSEYLYTQKGQRYLEAKKRELIDMQSLKREYMGLLGRIGPMERRLSASGDGSISEVMQEIINKIRVKSKVASIRHIDVKPLQGHFVSGAEVKLESLTPNQVLNILYLIDSDDRLVLIKEFILKSDFEDLDAFDMIIRVALISKK